MIFDKNSLEQMQRISHGEWRKKTEQPQTNADKDKTAKGHEWTRIKIECKHVQRLEGSRFIR
jgi:hypothetical protein